MTRLAVLLIALLLPCLPAYADDGPEEYDLSNDQIWIWDHDYQYWVPGVIR